MSELPYTTAAFQFHKGTIKTLCVLVLCRAQRYFNSIKVRLKPTLAMQPYIILVYFNSIKVRLKHEHKWYQHRLK